MYKRGKHLKTLCSQGLVHNIIHEIQSDKFVPNLEAHDVKYRKLSKTRARNLQRQNFPQKPIDSFPST